MRRFLRHVAPRLIGESGVHSFREPTADSTALQTIGSKTTHGRNASYGRMADHERDFEDSDGATSYDGEMTAVGSSRDSWPIKTVPPSHIPNTGIR